MASPNPGCFYEDGDDAGDVAERTADATTAAPAVYDEQYVLRNGATGQPLAGVPYEIRTALGQVIRGVTDGRGRTQRISSNSSETLQLSVIAGDGNV
ncbi:hypothetical protein [Paraburkholderia pallida]|uniref:Uncharacterized protein n=1 Tax=Paraburkholderia pallida TaxID=2547399 RepID=A0A4P7CK99_9BURK|nr:hypothetical protein [Paraburkholderia pallida]QBQ96078.1 hypothetical protein E1956_02040 [Paraburkholderia pallida]